MCDSARPTHSVHIVDDDPEIRSLLADMLGGSGYAVHRHDSPQAFLSALDQETPSCALVDLLMPGVTGLRLCEILAAGSSHCAFIVMSGQHDVGSAVSAMKLGAVDFLEKPFGSVRLLNAVHDGLRLAERRRREIVEENEATTRFQTLSARELEIFDRISAGEVSKEIAARLGISPRTVDVHRCHISQKLRIDSPTQLAHLISLVRRRRERYARIAADSLTDPTANEPRSTESRE